MSVKNFFERNEGHLITSDLFFCVGGRCGGWGRRTRSGLARRRHFRGLLSPGLLQKTYRSTVGLPKPRTFKRAPVESRVGETWKRQQTSWSSTQPNEGIQRNPKQLNCLSHERWLMWPHSSIFVPLLRILHPRSCFLSVQCLRGTFAGWYNARKARNN